ncbi:MAG: hypothetical protein LBC62_06205 [Treponema sp.]|jgi:hypothetical protein|nr:hypothetical protein [Treponema sp.]
MFDVRISGIIAGAAFVLSLLLGLISRAALPVLFVRALIFAVLFFVLSGLVYSLVSRFLPELLEDAKDSSEFSPRGSRVNIVEDDIPEPVPAVPGMVFAQPDDSEEDLGNISDLAAKNRSRPRQDVKEPDIPGLDLESQSDYTQKGQAEASSGSRDAPGSSGEAGAMDALPDLDSLAGAFLSSPGDEEEAAEYSAADPVKKQPLHSKGQKMEGDFNPKDLAAGIRTILNKED